MALKNIKAVFWALPTALVILRPDKADFTVESVNNAFLQLTEKDSEDWQSKQFIKTMRTFISDEHEENLSRIQSLVRTVFSTKETVESDILEFNLSTQSSAGFKNIYLQFKCSPVLAKDENVELLILTLSDVTGLLSSNEKSTLGSKRIKSREELHDLSEDLADQADASKAQYESASQELDDFVYSVSHDLRAPLRRIDGFSQELLNEYADKLDETGTHYLQRVRQGAQDMGQLIDDLLKLSRISRKRVEKEEIDLGKIAKTVFEELMELESEREVTLHIEEHLNAHADKGLIKAMFGNLISNALKFTSKRRSAEIQIGSKILDGKKVFLISDNGVGFDPAYSHKLFKAFSRLHSHNEFSGTGIGLATVKRIVTLHGGTIWAESLEHKGATFYFKL